jgi:hypothetical protein
VPATDDDIGPGLEEPPGDPGTDPSASAGDNRNLSREVERVGHGVVLPFPWACLAG